MKARGEMGEYSRACVLLACVGLSQSFLLMPGMAEAHWSVPLSEAARKVEITSPQYLHSTRPFWDLDLGKSMFGLGTRKGKVQMAAAGLDISTRGAIFGVPV